MRRFLKTFTICVTIICILFILVMLAFVTPLGEAIGLNTSTDLHRLAEINAAIKEWNVHVSEIEDLLANNPNVEDLFWERAGISFTRDRLELEITLYHREIQRYQEIYYSIVAHILLLFAVPTAILVLIFSILFLVKAIKYKCPKCKKLYGMRKVRGSKKSVGMDYYTGTDQISYEVSEFSNKVTSRTYGDVEFRREKFEYTRKCKRKSCGLEQIWNTYGKSHRVR